MLKNLKIGRKLIISFLCIAILASISGIAGVVLLTSTNKNYSKAMVENGFVLADLGNFNAYLNQGAALARDMLILTDPAELQSVQAELDAASAHTNTAWTEAVANCKTDAELVLVEKINAASPKYTEARQRAFDLALQNKRTEALALFRTEARPYLTECIEAGQQLMELNRELGTQVQTNLTRKTTIGLCSIAAVLAASLVASVLMGMYISSSISKPVQACANRLVLLAQGDLRTAVPPATSKDETGVMLNALEQTTTFLSGVIDEIGSGLGAMAKGNFSITSDFQYKGDFIALQTSINEILNSLNSTLFQINQASDQVASGSDQVSSGAQALSQGATEQASSVQELAATINEISHHVQDNANNANVASNKAKETAIELESGKVQMQQMVSAMVDINRSSEEIGKIIKAIEDIAFQTNILALNAAVEAARAGAAGKGFAVVADEVRNLASKSAEASKNTAALIARSIQAVGGGTKIANDTAQSLDRIVASSEETAALIHKISSASQEQASSINQVTLGIDQISSVVQTNSATAEESAAASEELSSQAQMLKQQVSKFHLRSSASRTSAPTPSAPVLSAPLHRSISSTSPERFTLEQY